MTEAIKHSCTLSAARHLPCNTHACTLCVFWCCMHSLIHAETQPSAVKSQHAKSGPSVTCWSNEQSVLCLCVCVWTLLACCLKVISWNKKAKLSPPVHCRLMLKGPPDTFPAAAVPTAEGLSLCHVPDAFYLHHSLSCVGHCCLTWLSVRLLTQVTIVQYLHIY